MATEWFDSHCHLHICEEERPVGDLLAEARAAGTTRMVTIGIDRASNERALELAREPGVWASVGVHPNSSEEWDEAAHERLRVQAASDEVVAIGESGLDFYRDHASPEQQERAFAAHIALATETGKALVIHTRESIGRALEVLEASGPPHRLVFHCWSGDESDLRRALDLGAHISFAGNVTFKSADALRAALPFVPRERLLLETDSPYLTPVPHRGTPNSPARIADTGAVVAEVLAVTAQDVAALTTANAIELFRVS